jgi:methylated-DNA-[protein]-cysteine S-methyltransferase
MTFSSVYESPVGEFVLEGDTASVSATREQLDAYFAGELMEFDVELDLDGTPFERDVWAAVSAIPYGETATYADIARRIGRPAACRAVGRANGRNPVAVIVPCHRVIGTSGALTGYAGGIEMKRALLEHERVSMQRVTGARADRAERAADRRRPLNLIRVMPA